MNGNKKEFTFGGFETGRETVLERERELVLLHIKEREGATGIARVCAIFLSIFSITKQNERNCAQEVASNFILFSKRGMMLKVLARVKIENKVATL